jgi:hypothetical protein
MQNIEYQYNISIIYHKNTSNLHNSYSNFSKFFDINKSFFQHRIDSFDNFYTYRNKPKKSDCQIIAIAIMGE